MITNDRRNASYGATPDVVATLGHPLESFRKHDANSLTIFRQSANSQFNSQKQKNYV